MKITRNKLSTIIKEELSASKRLHEGADDLTKLSQVIEQKIDDAVEQIYQEALSHLLGQAATLQHGRKTYDVTIEKVGEYYSDFGDSQYDGKPGLLVRTTGDGWDFGGRKSSKWVALADSRTITLK